MCNLLDLQPHALVNLNGSHSEVFFFSAQWMHHKFDMDQTKTGYRAPRMILMFVCHKIVLNDIVVLKSSVVLIVLIIVAE